MIDRASEAIGGAPDATPAGAALRDALAWSVAAGLVIALAEFAGSQHGIGDGWRDRVEWFARMAAHWVLAAVPFGLAFAWLDRRAAQRVPAWHEYALAVAAVAAFVVPVLAWAAPALLEPEMDRLLDGRPDYRTTLRFLAWQVVFWAALGAILHRYDVAGRVAAGRLRRAELARTAREHDVGRASMRATWARVVPGFLLEALRRIDALYGRAPAAADRAITALVAYLRLALAHHRRGVVPVASEAGLVEAYLRACDDEILEAEVAEPPSRSGVAAIESGIVVPALHRLRNAVVPPGEHASASVAVDVEGGQASFRVRLAGASHEASDVDLAALARELARGEDAPHIGARREAGGRWRFTITLPLAPPGAEGGGRAPAKAGSPANTDGGMPRWTTTTIDDAR